MLPPIRRSQPSSIAARLSSRFSSLLSSSASSSPLLVCLLLLLALFLFVSLAAYLPLLVLPLVGLPSTDPAHGHALLAPLSRRTAASLPSPEPEAQHDTQPVILQWSNPASLKVKELPVAGGGAAAVQPQPPAAAPSVLLPHHGDADARPPAASDSADATWSPRAAAIKAAFVHAYSKYEAKCFGQDEYRPLSGSCYNWIGAGLTIIDALPTMHVMGLTAEYGRAVGWLTSGLRFDSNLMTSFFETTIRVLGGLISAFDLTGDAALLEKATLLGHKLLPVFNTPTGIPLAQVNLATGATAPLSWTGGSSLLAELGTCQMEFYSLSQRSGDPRFATASQKGIDVIDRSKPAIAGLYPIYISPSHGGFTNSRIAWGAMGDSFYEYLLKWSAANTQPHRLPNRCSSASSSCRLFSPVPRLAVRLHSNST